jgi:hypothetical protein
MTAFHPLLQFKLGTYHAVIQTVYCGGGKKVTPLAAAAGAIARALAGARDLRSGSQVQVQVWAVYTPSPYV